MARAVSPRSVAMAAMSAFGFAWPPASGTSFAARSSVSIAAGASPASCSACASSICTRKLPGLATASAFSWSSVGMAGISGALSAARMPAKSASIFLSNDAWS